MRASVFIEPSSALAAELSRWLEGVYEIAWDSGETADCTVLVHDPPLADALARLEHFRAPAGWPRRAVVVVSRTADPNQRRALLRAGAMEVLALDRLELNDLAAAIEDAIARFSVFRSLSSDEGATKTSHRAEEQRRIAETFYHLIQNAPFGIYLVDADFRLVQVSQGSQKVFENVRPLLGRDFAEVLRAIWNETFASEAIGHFRHTLETGEPYNAPSTVEQRSDIPHIEAYDWRIERVPCQTVVMVSSAISTI